MNQSELIGKTIVCQGIRAEIAIVYSAECYDGLWSIEFRDTRGILRNWKQEFDGGHIE